MSKFRHELKYLCSGAELQALRTRLCPGVMKLDPHVNEEGMYHIKSIYFDDLFDTSFRENEAGVQPREKFRIRSYNNSDARISLECKRKENGMIRKTACMLTKEQYEKLVFGGDLMPSADYPALLNRFIVLKLTRGFEPKVIVGYDRIPFINPLGNVRVTFDLNIYSSKDFEHFFDADIATRSIMPVGHHLLEVKYDEYIPDTVYHAIQMRSMELTTFSKYYFCRKFSL